MVGIILNVFVKTTHFEALADAQGSLYRAGFRGLYGNKGAVMVHFILYGKKFTFINSHLPAHDEGTQKRIEDWRRINDARIRIWSKQDYVFWNGDLNFRIADHTLGASQIVSMVNSPEGIESTVEKDELKLLMASGPRMFEGWFEPDIKFKPTFKLDPETMKYNLKRRPAWTDRILYTSETGQKIVNKIYQSLPGYCGFDHEPVRGIFDIWIEQKEEA